MMFRPKNEQPLRMFSPSPSHPSRRCLRQSDKDPRTHLHFPLRPHQLHSIRFPFKTPRLSSQRGLRLGEDRPPARSQALAAYLTLAEVDNVR